jgi:protein ImuA
MSEFSESPKAQPQATRPNLEQLLRRNDLWRGHSQTFIGQAHWASGYVQLDQALLHNGWPLSTLVEICQARNTQSEWLLLAPAVRHACAQGGYTILLNPPSQPYVPGLIQQKINLDQLIVVQAQNKADFIASLVEILRAPVCPLLLGWEPVQALSYAELRKCQLATTDHPGLCILFRQHQQQQQSSPASLRLSTRLDAGHLELNLFKQRGKLRNRPVQIPLPSNWQALPLHRQLGQPVHVDQRPQSQQGAKLSTAKLLAFSHPPHFKP